VAPARQQPLDRGSNPDHQPVGFWRPTPRIWSGKRFLR
jgi:hypothetical protein